MYDTAGMSESLYLRIYYIFVCGVGCMYDCSDVNHRSRMTRIIYCTRTLSCYLTTLPVDQTAVIMSVYWVQSRSCYTVGGANERLTPGRCVVLRLVGRSV